MATNYPGSLDTWNNPNATTGHGEAGYEHHLAHSNLNDAVEAIEGELGTDPAGGAATVKARLGANDSRGWHPAFPTAGYWYSMDTAGTPAASAGVTTNRLYYRRIVFPVTATLAALGIYVSTGAGSSSVRVGVYNDSNGVPGSLLVDAGTASTASSSTWADIATTQQLLGGVVYWLASLFTGTPTVWAPSATSTTDGLGTAVATGTTTSTTRSVWHAQTYGALPSNASTVTWDNTTQPTVFVRF